MGLGPLRDLGPCEVWYGSTPAKIGPTFGDVVFTFKTATRAIKEDEKGISPVDKITMGIETCQVKVPFTRLTLGKLADVVPGAKFTQGTSTPPAPDIMAVSSEVGTSSADNGKELILKPIVAGVVSTDSGEWLHLLNAYPSDADMEITYNTEGQRVYTVNFDGFPEATTGVYWRIGPKAS